MSKEIKHICSIVFADIVGSSNYKTEQQKKAFYDVLNEIHADVQSRFQILEFKTMGDGFMLIASLAKDAAEAALIARDKFINRDWRKDGFPEDIKIRCGLHIDKVVFDEKDGKLEAVSCPGLDYASRIEPVAKHNHVYCTDHFYNQLVLEDDSETIVGFPLGKKELAKGAGYAELYDLKWAGEVEQTPASEEDSHIPTLRRKVTDRDKDKYLEEAFSVVRNYFRQSSSRMEQKSQDVECVLREIDAFKFTCEVFVEGDSKQSCMIWLSPAGTMDQGIAYSSSFHSVNDTSLNERLMVEVIENEIFLKPLMGFSTGATEKDKYNQQEAAEYLWERFVQYLNNE